MTRGRCGSLFHFRMTFAFTTPRRFNRPTRSSAKPNPVSMNNSSEYQAYVITGPTSGIGRATTLEVIKHGKVVLVGRDREKLNQLRKEVERKGGQAVSVVCDLADLASVRRAAAEIIALHLPIAGLLNNAGIFPMSATKNALEI